MKKWILIFCFFLIAGTGAVYLFIPNVKIITDQSVVTCTDAGAMRIILDESKWQNWWPGQKKMTSLFSYKNVDYRIDKLLLNGFDFTVYKDKDSAKGNLQVISNGTGSSFFIWSYNILMPSNPFSKLIKYIGQNDISSNIESLTKEINQYFTKEENIYGMNVIMQKVTDSVLISLKNTYDHYPSVEEVYTMIGLVKEYINKKGGQENNYPMLNVYREGQAKFETMVAVPTKTVLPVEGNFYLKKMVLGNILMTEVKGGIYRIMKGEIELANYVKDHKKSSPAIPFQSLVTNRQLEPDSSKWITRLYYPVFY